MRWHLRFLAWQCRLSGQRLLSTAFICAHWRPACVRMPRSPQSGQSGREEAILRLPRLALADPRPPPGPLRPGQEALHLAKPAIAAVKRLLSVKWDFGRPLQDQVPSLQYDHHLPALVQAFVVPPATSFTRRLAFQLWRARRWMSVHL